MKIYRIAQIDLDALEFENQHVDCHSGQNDYNLIAKIKDQPVGLIEYSEYMNEIYINNMIVHVDMRRRGIGTRMHQELKRLYPNVQIHWGIVTDDGMALKESLD